MSYPSFVRRLAEEQDAGRLHVRPKTISATAEALGPQVRELVRATWGARTLNSYGTTEGGLIGTKCAVVAGVHVADDLLVFEVVSRRWQDVDRTPDPRVRELSRAGRRARVVSGVQATRASVPRAVGSRARAQRPRQSKAASHRRNRGRSAAARSSRTRSEAPVPDGSVTEAVLIGAAAPWRTTSRAAASRPL